MICSLPAGGSHLACYAGMPAYTDPHFQPIRTDGAVDLWLCGADPHHQCTIDALAAESHWVRAASSLHAMYIYSTRVV